MQTQSNPLEMTRPVQNAQRSARNPTRRIVTVVAAVALLATSAALAVGAINGSDTTATGPASLAKARSAAPADAAQRRAGTVPQHVFRWR